MTKILVDKLVLEQALEALECVDLQSLVPDYGSGHYSVSRLDGPHLKSAITVLRAAMAEPMQESVKMPTTAAEAELMVKAGLMWLEQNAPDRLLKPAQEPVFEVGFGWLDDATKYPRRTKLYVAPPPVEPAQEPVAYIHRQGNHFEVSERHLDEDEKARGWTEEPLYTAPSQLGKGVVK